MEEKNSLSSYLSQTSKKQKKVGERIRKKIENKKFKTGSLELHITVSMGLSIFDPDKDNLNFQEEADKALYEAKNNGRNQLVIFENKS